MFQKDVSQYQIVRSFCLLQCRSFGNHFKIIDVINLMFPLHRALLLIIYYWRVHQQFVQFIFLIFHPKKPSQKAFFPSLDTPCFKHVIYILLFQCHPNPTFFDFIGENVRLKFFRNRFLLHTFNANWHEIYCGNVLLNDPIIWYIKMWATCKPRTNCIF